MRRTSRVLFILPPHVSAEACVNSGLNVRVCVGRPALKHARLHVYKHSCIVRSLGCHVCDERQKLLFVPASHQPH